MHDLCIFIPLEFTESPTDQHVQEQIAVSILGASGYSGAELMRILLRHPGVRIERLFAGASAGKELGEIHPWFAGRTSAALEAYHPDAAGSSDLVFLALPSGEAMRVVPELLERGKKVIDLGGDFRLSEPALYQTYYGRAHAAPALLGAGVYGLPEWNRDAVRSCSLIANPGCYPTSAILPLAPLLKEGIVAAEGIVVDSMSGVSGAGRSGSVELSFCEVNENVRAYKVGTHQHIPEMEGVLGALGGMPVTLSFTPHLIPITRGIYTTSYAALREEISEGRIEEIFHDYYGSEPFVRFSGSAVPEIRNVAGSNYIDIGFRIDRRNNRLVLLSAIDNLVKGAAGQAVQNMNILFGFNETEALR